MVRLFTTHSVIELTLQSLPNIEEANSECTGPGQMTVTLIPYSYIS